MNYIIYVCSILSEYFFILLKKKSDYYTIYVSINAFSRKRCFSKKLSKRLLLGRHSIPFSNIIKEHIKESEMNSDYICDLVFRKYELNKYRPKFIYSYEL